MKLGIDFGTTRIVVAAADRGNYPLVAFETPEGVYDWFPCLAAVRNGGSGFEYRFGWEAWNSQSEPGWTILRSLKRYLNDAGPESTLPFSGELRVSDLLTGMTTALRRNLQAKLGEKEPFEIMLGVPANANSNQRFLTVDAFRRAGFTVLGMLNEPSAASIEFNHRQKGKGKILVYDLGGGTFDVSVVEATADRHTVIACDGVTNLGGDDFDYALAERAVGKGELFALHLGQLFRLLEECRRQKEALHANSRKIVVDLDQVSEGMGQATINVSEFYDLCRPMLQETIRVTSQLAERHDIDALYVTGGGSELPLVARALREQFGRKVKRSEYTRSATAIGLAIQADESSGYQIDEMFNRNFAVWREADSGQRMILDPIFPRGTRLPPAGEPPLIVRREYCPVHNVGHFRYLEAGGVDTSGQPEGDLTIWDEIFFPFDPDLELTTVETVSVGRNERAPNQCIEEQYACDAAGVVKVKIRNVTAGYERDYQLACWDRSVPATGKSRAKRSAKKAS